MFTALMAAACILLFVAYVLLLWGAFGVSIIWGAVVLVFPGLGGFVFSCCHWDRAKAGVAVFALGVCPLFLFVLFSVLLR